MKKIAVVTGARSEYGILKPIIKVINRSEKLETQLVVTGLHLTSEFGSTVKEIEKEFKIDARVPSCIGGDFPSAMSMSTGIGVYGLAQAFEQLKPDVVLITGDRCEALSAAIAATYMNIPIAHCHGGEVTGGCIDESPRNAITKLAHVHFVSNSYSAVRVVAMGEKSKRVHIVGAPAVDEILDEDNYMTKQELVSIYGFNLSEDWILLVYHPEINSWVGTRDRIECILKAIGEYPEKRLIWVKSGNDVGYSDIEEDYVMYVNVPQKIYINFMRHSDVMIGNSSSGIIEAAYLGLPVINVGDRQKGRERTGNVINIPYDVEEIHDALILWRRDSMGGKIEQLYGDGTASRKIVKVLEELVIDNKLLRKGL